MVRTQISLGVAQHEKLRRIAERRGVSMSMVLRELLARAIDEEDEARRRTLSIIGKYRSGVPDLAENHDTYLAEAEPE